MDHAQYELIIDPELAPCPVLPALVWAEGIASPTASQEHAGPIAEAVAQARDTGEAYVPPEVRSRVRNMLRHGRYKPTGRGKPASEFLLRAALGGEFPHVNAPVDVNNWVSLESGFPGSIFDVALSGRRLLLRRGRPGEAYVFNPSGQVLELEDLLLVCRKTEHGWEPCGSPIKDAMITKLSAHTRDVIAILYAPNDEPPESVERWASRFAERLGEQCSAQRTGYRVLDMDRNP